MRGVIDAQRYVVCTYNVPRGPKLDECCHITPGKRAPTITSLEDVGWVAVSAMVERNRIATAMDDLIRAGAEDVLTMSLDNTRTRQSNAK